MSADSSFSNFKRRTRFLVNPQFQLTFALYMGLLNLAVIGVFFAAGEYFFWRLRTLGVSLGLAENHVFFKFADEQHAAMLGIYALTAVGASVIILVFGLYLSHRVAGPLTRLRTFFEVDLARDPNAKLNFRPRDFFRDIPPAVNNYVDVANSKSSLTEKQNC